jgi:hypothetical protein
MFERHTIAKIDGSRGNCQRCASIMRKVPRHHDRYGVLDLETRNLFSWCHHRENGTRTSRIDCTVESNRLHTHPLNSRYSQVSLVWYSTLDKKNRALPASPLYGHHHHPHHHRNWSPENMGSSLSPYTLLSDENPERYYYPDDDDDDANDDDDDDDDTRTLLLLVEKLAENEQPLLLQQQENEGGSSGSSNNNNKNPSDAKLPLLGGRGGGQRLEEGTTATHLGRLSLRDWTLQLLSIGVVAGNAVLLLSAALDGSDDTESVQILLIQGVLIGSVVFRNNLLWYLCFLAANQAMLILRFYEAVSIWAEDDTDENLLDMLFGSLWYMFVAVCNGLTLAAIGNPLQMERFLVEMPLEEVILDAKLKDECDQASPLSRYSGIIMILAFLGNMIFVGSTLQWQVGDLKPAKWAWCGGMLLLVMSIVYQGGDRKLAAQTIRKIGTSLFGCLCLIFSVFLWTDGRNVIIVDRFFSVWVPLMGIAAAIRKRPMVMMFVAVAHAEQGVLVAVADSDLEVEAVLGAFLLAAVEASMVAMLSRKGPRLPKCWRRCIHDDSALDSLFLIFVVLTILWFAVSQIWLHSSLLEGVWDSNKQFGESALLLFRSETALRWMPYST